MAETIIVKVCKANRECCWDHKSRIICCHYCPDNNRCPEKCPTYERGISYDDCVEKD